jgi:hypothetical protein
VAICPSCDTDGANDFDRPVAGAMDSELIYRAARVGGPGEGAGGREELDRRRSLMNDLLHEVFPCIESPRPDGRRCASGAVVHWAGKRREANAPLPGHSVAACFSAVTNPGSHGVLKMQVRAAG